MREREIPRPIYIPDVIDIEVTSRCEFNCPDCWGSKTYNNIRELTAKQWLKIFEKLDETVWSHTDRIVITGGEPLMRNDLINIINGLKVDDEDRYISLSTTGNDRFNQLPDIIKLIDTIGIPIDGPSPETHSRWRSHNKLTDGGLELAVNTLKMVQCNRPDLQTSIRTLIHPNNIDYIEKIPKFLEESGIDISRLRWILYELNHRVQVEGESRLISSNSIINSTIGEQKFYNNIEFAGRNFSETIIRSIGNIAGRNFLISPIGETRAVIKSESGKYLIEEKFGNIHKDYNNTIELLNNDIVTLGKFSADAYNSPEYFYSTEN